ncbi:hypothetical protein L5F35_03925 [Aliarcobacter butzleri]|uniref:hypothetical protein n=1 Tax=Aliarcobacter butzleri TaxID=28197 RepID=UPI001EDA9BD3|nr:hypothetical protein [Aliarcobacter butzleri]MCG3685359.1 hypothetical protein [Aliarcobacter butzleri]
MRIEYKFMNDILKPWDELNELLSQPYCVEPGLSTFTKMATDIATSISHFAETSGIETREKGAKACLSNQIMIDIADMCKHGKLRKSDRENEINVSSIFEYIEPSKFKFLRNIINIKHNTHGNHDFMKSSLQAIFYWTTKLGIDLKRELIISSNLESEKATLFFNPNFCIHAEKATLNFKKKDIHGNLVDYDPSRFYIEILDLEGKVKAYADVKVK